MAPNCRHGRNKSHSTLCKSEEKKILKMNGAWMHAKDRLYLCPIKIRTSSPSEKKSLFSLFERGRRATHVILHMSPLGSSSHDDPSVQHRLVAGSE
jgi:hypothetical protein